MVTHGSRWLAQVRLVLEGFLGGFYQPSEQVTFVLVYFFFTNTLVNGYCGRISRSIIQDNQDMDVALVKYRVSAVQVSCRVIAEIVAAEKIIREQ